MGGGMQCEKMGEIIVLETERWRESHREVILIVLNKCISETLILSDSNFISARNKEAWNFEGQVNFKKKEMVSTDCGEKHAWL